MALCGAPSAPKGIQEGEIGGGHLVIMGCHPLNRLCTEYTPWQQQQTTSVSDCLAGASVPSLGESSLAHWRRREGGWLVSVFVHTPSRVART